MPTGDYIQQLENKGRKILKTLIVVNIIMFCLILVSSIANGIFSNMIGLFLLMIICVFIYHGGNIAKWLYIVIGSLNIISIVSALLFSQILLKAPLYLNVLSVLMLCITIITIMLLLYSSSVKEFMYKQGND